MERRIKVSCRVRPVLPSEETKPLAAWELNGGSVTLPLVQRVTFEGKGIDRVEETFMESTYNPTKSNEEVYAGFHHIVRDSVEEGLNGAILAYGQTGSGKTYSIVGQPNDSEEESVKGLMGIAVENVFRLKKEDQKIKMSYMEIYMEKVNDLLGKQTNLAVKEDMTGPNGGFFVDGLLEREVHSAREVIYLATKAEKKRRVIATRFNEQSSRSHTILTIQIITPREDTADLMMTTVSKLMIVDLAGNERVNDQVSYMSESNSINKSLFFLGEVISRLSQCDDHIPYRNSKLTSILSVHLGQNANTALLVTLHPLEEYINESLMTLRFAQKASTIKCEVRPVLQSKEHMIILKQREVIAQLREKIHEMEFGASPCVNVNRKPDVITMLQEKQKALEADKHHLQEVLRHVGGHIEQLARRAADAAGASPAGDAITRLGQCIDVLEGEMRKMKEMEQKVRAWEKLKPEHSTKSSIGEIAEHSNKSENSTREPTPIRNQENVYPENVTVDTEKMREENGRLVESERKMREENSRLRTNAKYLASERDRWRNECKQRIDENIAVIEQKDLAIRESDERRKQFEVEMAMCTSALQSRVHELTNEKNHLENRAKCFGTTGNSPAVQPENLEETANTTFSSTKTGDSDALPLSPYEVERKKALAFVHSPVPSPRGADISMEPLVQKYYAAQDENRPNRKSTKAEVFPGVPSRPSQYSYERIPSAVFREIEIQDQMHNVTSSRSARQDRRDESRQGSIRSDGDVEKPIKWSARDMFLVSPSIHETLSPQIPC